MSSIAGVRFHPTDAELINFLKKFLNGEALQCPIKVAEIYGDRPPWQIFGAEEKIGYFITPLKKRKKSYERHVRTCANGTWRGQTSGKPIKNRKGSVVGFRRNYIYQSRSKEEKKNSSINWLMREYFVGDDFFREKNIPKQEEFAVCRIKKHMKEKKVKDDAITTNMEEDVVEGIIQGMLLGPDAYRTTHQVMEQDLIIDDQQAEVDDTTLTLMNGEYDDLRGCNYQQNDQILLDEAGMEIQNITWSDTSLEQEAYGQIEQVEEANIELQEEMNRILEDITVNVPDDWWQLDDQSLVC